MTPDHIETLLAPPVGDARPRRPEDDELFTESNADTQRVPHILIVDDDSFMLGIQSRMLRSMGYEKVSSAGSGEAALMMLQSGVQPVDVILCDLNMPGMDGIEFLQALNAGSFAGKVILISGEGARIMHTVQKLLGDCGLVIIGAIEKPAAKPALGALLQFWESLPVGRTLADAPPSFSDDELRGASREGQWVLHYQPKVQLATTKLTGVEALVRWKHPKLGLLYPDSFVGKAEDCGAIDALTQSVLQTAVGQLSRWHSQGLPLQMAVNLSMENLRSPDFVRTMGTLMRSASVAPQDLTLEITESRLMAPSSIPLETLVRLRMQRFGLSVDDFGTGHSSLAQLRDVPFTELKVDRGFVHGARYNQLIRPILEGSIGIAKRLGMTSVAEGVESEEDWRLLREIGCDSAQGYFIGRPMPAERIPEWIEVWDSRRRGLFQS